MSRDVLSLLPPPSLAAVRKPPRYALTARAKISVLLPQRPLTDYFDPIAYGLKPSSRKIGHCTFAVFRDFVQGQVENADGLLCWCELDRPKDVFRNVWQFVRLNRVTVATLALWFERSVSARMKSAAKRSYAWFLRQLKKHFREAA